MKLQNSLAAGLVVLAAGTAACRGDEPVQDTRNAATQAGATAGDVLSDARITTAIQAKYYSDDRIRGRHIDVDTQDGNITLRGAVPDDAARQHAVALARSVDGVRNVTDQLQVRADTAATSPPDATAGSEVGTAGRDDERQPGWITTKIQAQYFIDPDLSPWSIDVTTGSGGVVTLEGTVDSNEDKNDALRIARETEGVTRVDDKLRVVPEGDRATPATGVDAPDPWLTAKIQSKYFIDADVKGRRIDVDTQNGVVTLTGTVGSETARRQAVALARNTDGVREVQDQLKVEPTAGGETAKTGTKPTTVERPDGWLTTKIQAQYFLDPDVKGHQIDVDTTNGVVTLKGFVESAAQKTEAEQIARETEGVRRVINQLTIGAGG